MIYIVSQYALHFNAYLKIVNNYNVLSFELMQNK